MDDQELETFFGKPESELIEFKLAENDYDLGKLCNYVSAFANEANIQNKDFGYVILGVEPKKHAPVGTNYRLKNLQSIKHDIFQKTQHSVFVEEKSYEEKRLVIFKIPRGPKGVIVKSSGISYGRENESLVPLTDVKREMILSQNTFSDWSAEIIPNTNIDDLYLDALKKFEVLYKKRNKTDFSYTQILKNISLVSETGCITRAALILLGSEKSLQKHASQAEIQFFYRHNVNDINYSDRVNYREAYILAQEKIWSKIYSRNFVTQISEGFITREIPAYNEDVIKEAINNAVVHRDYNDYGSIVLKQSPELFEVTSPGGLLPGITIENIIDTPSKQRNKLLAETLEKIGFVQRAGQGMDTIFKKSIEEGKGKPDLGSTDLYYVILKLSAQVQDQGFIKFLQKVISEKQISFSANDLILLQDLLHSSRTIKKEEVQRFLDIGIVEKIGNTRGVKYMLSHRYYASQNQTGTYTKLKGISRDAKKHLILEHLKRNSKGAVLGDFVEAFPDITRQDVSNLLQELKRDNKIIKIGNTNSAVWRIE